MPVKFKIQGHLIRRIVAYTKPYRWLFYGAMAITLVLSGMSIARPLFINAAIQSVTDQQNQMHAFYVWCNLILFSLITESALQIVNLRMTSILGQRIFAIYGIRFFSIYCIVNMPILIKTRLAPW